ncbi:hypothetical protein KC842_01625 [Candidatus Nomurabacteria bacterium]|nr:hypothetical protein [Candidatus Nomurabacteria bacterium]USN94488.1 MAG: hypothetical protein H6791_01855 [Candidatus Nomurabacteria bacterium]
MKINKELALRYIGNPKFCSSSEALQYAKGVGDSDVWQTVLGRADVQEYLQED